MVDGNLVTTSLAEGFELVTEGHDLTHELHYNGQRGQRRLNPAFSTS